MKKIRMIVLIVLTVVFCCPLMAEADDMNLTYRIYKDICAEFRKNNERLRANTEVISALVEEKVSNDVAVKFRNSAYVFLDEALKMIDKSDDLLKSLPNDTKGKIESLKAIGKKIEMIGAAHRTINATCIAIIGGMINNTKKLDQLLDKNFGI